MSNPAGASSTATVPASPAGRSGGDSSELITSQGRTQIAGRVVSKIAGVATREVTGVYQLDGGTARAFGAIRERIPGASTNAMQGVAVEVGEKQAAVDLDIVVEYGVAIADLAGAVRRNVLTTIERMTGLEVVEVNISVNDVHLPTDDANDSGDAQPEQSRVQ